jgi:hypothetical protein
MGPGRLNIVDSMFIGNSTQTRSCKEGFRARCNVDFKTIELEGLMALRTLLCICGSAEVPGRANLQKIFVNYVSGIELNCMAGRLKCICHMFDILHTTSTRIFVNCVTLIMH